MLIAVALAFPKVASSAATQAVMTWGYNAASELGDGTRTNKSLPISIANKGVLNGKNVVKIVGGDDQNYALCSDGTVAAWGDNSSGQLGDGTTVERSLPIDITSKGVLSGKTVTDLVSGGYHALAICSDGTIAAWGENWAGTLGDGTETDRLLPVAINKKGALNNRTVVQLVTSYVNTFAICSDGTIAAWGDNSSGQFGNGTTTGSDLPIAIPNPAPGKTLVQLVAKGESTLALFSDGTLAAWGSNGEGELGDGTYTSRSTPVFITGKGALNGKKVSYIGAGYSMSFALCTDGTVAAWGYNSDGELGDGTTTNRNLPVAITNKGALSGKKVTFIASGESHALALCTDGTVVAWGANNSGQLGDGSITDRHLPVAITSKGSLSGTRVTQLIAGESHSGALAIIDTVAPTVQVTTPTVNQGLSFSSFNTITGTASDNVAVSQVLLKLSRVRGGVTQYWSGTGFGSTQVLLSAKLSAPETSDTGWSYAISSALKAALDEGVYTIVSYARDEVAKQSAAASRSFTLYNDSVAPDSVVVTIPANTATVASLPAISGTASDAGSGLGRVELYLKRNSDGVFWGDTSWGSTTSVALTTTLNSSGAWSRASGLPLVSTTDTTKILNEGSYTITARAYDKAGNALSKNSTFTVDKTPPSSVLITTPASASTLTDLSGILGSAKDSGGLSQVELLLQRNTDLLYWNGSGWGNAAVPLATTLSSTGSWSCSSPLPSTTSTDNTKRLTNGGYTVTATAYDKARNKTSAKTPFAIDVTAPNSVVISSPKPSSTVSSLPSVSGTASDANSGILRVEVYLKRNVDGVYWAGKIWGNATAQPLPTSLTSLGGNNWSWKTNGQMPSATSTNTSTWLQDGAYTLIAIAYDKAGNSNSTKSVFNVLKPAPLVAPSGSVRISGGQGAFDRDGSVGSRG